MKRGLTSPRPSIHLTSFGHFLPPSTASPLYRYLSVGISLLSDLDDDHLSAVIEPLGAYRVERIRRVHRTIASFLLATHMNGLGSRAACRSPAMAKENQCREWAKWDVSCMVTLKPHYHNAFCFCGQKWHRRQQTTGICRRRSMERRMTKPWSTATHVGVEE